MRPLLAPEEMARFDRATVDSGTPGAMLMERAGRAAARSALPLAGGRYGKRAAVVAGKGNNGGDGFVCARALAREGLAVRCLLVGDADSLKGDPATHLTAARRAGVTIQPFVADGLKGADAVIDALFGTGFRGAAEGEAAAAIEAMNTSGAPVLAIDIPSGVDGATGGIDGPAVRADATIAMAAEKLGSALPPGCLAAGVVAVADIGIDVTSWTVEMAEGVDVSAVLPRRSPAAHKRSAGIVLVLAGSRGLSGAAILTARGAARAGAGYVILAATAEVEATASARLPEVVKRVVGSGEVLDASALDVLGRDLESASVVAIGPGLGSGDPQSKLVARVLEQIEKPVVVDADGLNVLAGNLDALVHRKAPTVVTPHPGELGRLLDTSAGAVQADRLGSARRAAERFGCTVLLKGLRTLVAEPSGRVVVVPVGGPELATAGTGDVLTGIVASLIAGGAEPYAAAWAAAYVHGLAGSAAGAGRTGLLAWDVAEAVPEVLGRL